MEPVPDRRRELLDRIGERRAGVAAYLRRIRPRRDRLITTSIVSSALAAVLTAGPALGGRSFADTVGRALSLRDTSAVWRLLCLGALVVSVVAVISTNLAESRGLERRVNAAEACKTELEGLATLLEFGRLPVGDAAELYRQYVAKIPFVDETTPHRPGGMSAM
ncbi:MAG: hypothetical protein QOC93_2064 [Actinomycetota bacterium]|jgi:MFS family permease|nr:hypothetical protein [Cryptosporangiaceae bacterium]MDQ1676920.1 hypothetical protein [Actinomycetota bacterium]